MAHTHYIWFGLPATANNKRRMQALHIIVHVLGISNADRTALVTLQKTVDQLKLDYPARASQIEEHRKGFASMWSNDNGATLTHYLGAFVATLETWTALEDWIPTAPNGIRYAHFTQKPGTHFCRVVSSNVAAIQNLSGTDQVPRALLASIGLVPYKPA